MLSILIMLEKNNR